MDTVGEILGTQGGTGSDTGSLELDDDVTGQLRKTYVCKYGTRYQSSSCTDKLLTATPIMTTSMKVRLIGGI